MEYPSVLSCFINVEYYTDAAFDIVGWMYDDGVVSLYTKNVAYANGLLPKAEQGDE